MPADDEKWPTRVMTVVAAEIKRHRKRLNLSAQELSEACSRIGYPMSRVVITKLESGYRPTITLPELLVLARALGVAPLQIVCPVGSVSDVEILPGRVVSAWDAGLWLEGTVLPEALLSDDPDDYDVWISGTQALALWRRHAQLVADWFDAASTARRQEQAIGLGAAWDLFELKERVLQAELRRIREECDRLDIERPPLPRELVYVDGGSRPSWRAEREESLKRRSDPGRYLADEPADEGWQA